MAVAITRKLISPPSLSLVNPLRASPSSRCSRCGFLLGNKMRTKQLMVIDAILKENRNA